MKKPERCRVIEEGLEDIFGDEGVEKVEKARKPRWTKSPRSALDRLVAAMGARVVVVGKRYVVKSEGTVRKKEEILRGAPDFEGSVWNVLGHLLFVATTPKEVGGFGMSNEKIREICQWRPPRTKVPKVGEWVITLPDGVVGWAETMIDKVFMYRIEEEDDD